MSKSERLKRMQGQRDVMRLSMLRSLEGETDDALCVIGKMWRDGDISDQKAYDWVDERLAELYPTESRTFYDDDDECPYCGG